MHEPLCSDSPPHPLAPQKEGIVLCCLIVLGAGINESLLWVCACLGGYVWYFLQMATEMKKIR